MNLRRALYVGLLVAAVTVTSLFGQGQSPQESANKSTHPPQKVVVHLSHFTDDLHRCFMALKMANLMQEHGADVTIFLDLEGVRLAERRQELDLTWGIDSPKLSDHYKNFIESGGSVVLCPHCAKSARIGSMGLKKNAEIGTMPTLGKLLVEADKIMDY